MATNVLPPTEQFYNVRDMIADLKAGKFNKPAQGVKPAPKPAIEVGARINVPALGIAGKLVAVQPPSVPGGVTRYRVGWLEPAAGNAYREAGFWLEDIEVVAAKSR